MLYKIYTYFTFLSILHKILHLFCVLTYEKNPLTLYKT
jgi:hypothetical protein